LYGRPVPALAVVLAIAFAAAVTFFASKLFSDIIIIIIIMIAAPEPTVTPLLYSISCTVNIDTHGVA
jgi:hypothetical protein